MRKSNYIVILITLIFALVFTGIGVLSLFVFLSEKQESWLLMITAVFLYVGISALKSSITLIKEIKILNSEFFPFENRNGSESIIRLAEKLSQRFNGLNYIIQTNEEAIMIFQDLTSKELNQLNEGKKFNSAGILLIRTMNPVKFKQVTIEVQIEKLNHQVVITPAYIGGKSVKYESTVELSYDKENGITKNQLSSHKEKSLATILRESKKEDGWKTTLDAVSLFAIQMAVLGAVGALITGIVLLLDW